MDSKQKEINEHISNEIYNLIGYLFRETYENNCKLRPKYDELLDKMLELEQYIPKND